MCRNGHVCQGVVWSAECGTGGCGLYNTGPRGAAHMVELHEVWDP